jgi:hypothetical protein
MCVQRKIFSRLLAAVLFLTAALNLSAQGNAISYQGQLNVSGTPANTNYDFRFAVYDAVTNGNRISLLLTNFAVPVSNGLFAVTLNFGAGIFNGTDNGSNDWLDIGVRAAGGTNFTTLAPREPILPVPYATFATSASNLLGGLQSTQLVGTISPALIAGTFPGSVNFSNAANTFTGTFSGNGASLTSLNGSYISQGTVADARLSGNVALLNASQSFSGANTFSGASTFSGSGTYSGVNTFSNGANYFQGNFFGNGLVGWFPISGTTVTAMRDAGYLMQSASLSTVTLPATASLSVDDIVRVSGGGGGGWQIKENSGQFITGNFASYKNGTVVLLTSGSYAGIAGSGDGVRLYAVGGGAYAVSGVNGFLGIFASSDSGVTWTQVGVNYVSGYCSSVACSANGKIVYVQFNNGTVEKSTDSGATWTSAGSGTVNNFIACTADGSTLITGNVACSGNGTYRAKLSGGSISVSINSGSTFPVGVTAPAAGVTCLAVSSDCTKLVAAVSNGLLYASSNLGATWTTLTATNQTWSSVWMSADGSKFAATVGTVQGVPGGVNYCNLSPLPNTSTTTTSGSLCGSQGSAVELQYLGGGQFMPVGSTGLLWAN